MKWLSIVLFTCLSLANLSAQSLHFVHWAGQAGGEQFEIMSLSDGCIPTYRWLQADIACSITVVAGCKNASTTTWGDQSGWGEDASITCCDSTKAPFLEPTTCTRTINCLNVLDFDGTDNHLQMKNIDLRCREAFVVFESDNIACDPVQVLLGSKGGANNQWRFSCTGLLSYGAALPYYCGTPCAVITGNPCELLTVSTTEIVGWTFDPTLQMTTNGCVYDAGSCIPACESGYTLGEIGGRQNGTQPFDGKIAEVFVTAGLLSDYNRERLIASLHYKWGAEAQLPCSSPYSNSPPSKLWSPTCESAVTLWTQMANGDLVTGDPCVTALGCLVSSNSFVPAGCTGSVIYANDYIEFSCEQHLIDSSVPACCSPIDASGLHTVFLVVCMDDYNVDGSHDFDALFRVASNGCGVGGRRPFIFHSSFGCPSSDTIIHSYNCNGGAGIDGIAAMSGKHLITGQITAASCGTNRIYLDGGFQHGGCGICTVTCIGIQTETTTAEISFGHRNLESTNTHKARELVFTAGAISTDLKDNIEGYLMWKHGITPASGHTYETKPPFVPVP